jgi:hypothetical protein
MCAPTYLEKCVETLNAHPSIVIAYPRTLIVDENGSEINEYEFHPATDEPSASRRFAELVLVNHRLHRAVEIFGLMRASALLRTPLEGAYARGDSVLLARMALLGRFVELPERLFLSRHHATQSMQTLPSHANGGHSVLSCILGTGPLPPPEWWDASRKGRVNFPEWNLFKEYLLSIGRVCLPPTEQFKCHLVMLRWVLRNMPKLARDVLFAGEILSARVIDRVRAAGDPAGSIGQ